MKITNKELDEMLKICDAATPGPWVDKFGKVGVGFTTIAQTYLTSIMSNDPQEPAWLRATANSRFIALAGTHFTRIIHELEQLQEKLEAIDSMCVDVRMSLPTWSLIQVIEDIEEIVEAP